MYYKKVFNLLLTLVTILENVTSSELYLNEWSVHIPGGRGAADQFAKENGFVNLGEIIPGSGEFHLKYPRRSKRSAEQDESIQKRILKHFNVSSAEQLVEKKRYKRDLVYPVRYHRYLLACF
jgi:hypothetical protein